MHVVEVSPWNGSTGKYGIIVKSVTDPAADMRLYDKPEPVVPVKFGVILPDVALE